MFSFGIIAENFEFLRMTFSLAVKNVGNFLFVDNLNLLVFF